MFGPNMAGCGNRGIGSLRWRSVRSSCAAQPGWEAKASRRTSQVFHGPAGPLSTAQGRAGSISVVNASQTSLEMARKIDSPMNTVQREMEDAGWRARIGWIQPPKGTLDPFLFTQIAPPGLRVIPTLIHVSGLSDDLPWGQQLKTGAGDAISTQVVEASVVSNKREPTSSPSPVPPSRSWLVAFRAVVHCRRGWNSALDFPLW